MIRSAMGENIHAEVTYKNGVAETYGTKDGVRLDIVIGPKDNPQAVIDLKTGKARLTQKRVDDIRKELPRGGVNVPIIEVRPDGSTIEW